LRKAAEEILSRKKGGSQEAASEDLEKLIHELQVHQIELEMQNDELRRSQEEIEYSRNRYVDLYDFAPVGYFTLHQTGLIMELNLTGAVLLGVERRRLLQVPFASFIVAEDQNRFRECQRRIFQNPGRQSCDLRLRRPAGDPLWVRLEGLAREGPDGKLTGARLTVTDITERKGADEALQASENRLQELSSKLLNFQEMERKIIADEIHDELLSNLAAVNYSLESNVLTLERAGHPLVPDLRKLLNIQQKTIKEARRIMNRLHPSILDELGLIPALTSFCREIEELFPSIHGECKFAAKEEEIPIAVKVVIFRVAQEAMTNSARHGGAGGSIEVSLTTSLDRIEFVAQDHGPGFDFHTVKKGIGLESMKERVENSGGKFRLESAPGQGTRIQATWRPPLTS